MTMTDDYDYDYDRLCLSKADGMWKHDIVCQLVTVDILSQFNSSPMYATLCVCIYRYNAIITNIADIY